MGCRAIGIKKHNQNVQSKRMGFATKTKRIKSKVSMNHCTTPKSNKEDVSVTGEGTELKDGKERIKRKTKKEAPFIYGIKKFCSNETLCWE
jgi:hypothetical protein